jgi:hypothetical protein
MRLSRNRLTGHIDEFCARNHDEINTRPVLNSATTRVVLTGMAIVDHGIAQASSDLFVLLGATASSLLSWAA